MQSRNRKRWKSEYCVNYRCNVPLKIRKAHGEDRRKREKMHSGTGLPSHMWRYLKTELSPESLDTWSISVSSSYSICGQADPNFPFHSPSPLSKMSCWMGARPAITFSAEAASTMTSFTQPHPLGSKLPTFRYTDGGISVMVHNAEVFFFFHLWWPVS